MATTTTSMPSQLSVWGRAVTHPTLVPLVMALGAVLPTVAAQLLFTSVTECPCMYSVVFTTVALTGPTLPFSFWSSALLRRLCRTQNRNEKVASMRGVSLLTAASLTWTVTALFNQEILCCMMTSGGISNERCMTTPDPVIIEYCTSVSTISGAVIMVISIIIVYVLLLASGCFKDKNVQDQDGTSNMIAYNMMSMPGPTERPHHTSNLPSSEHF
ncbi:uncharacterized protein LOC133356401 isoform X1 [Lethenteron reissneri]|uniref:uncharacterized protein LOC133356401 isoform X1 n=1 Tax=Lethenteron reissneri TaxID=7753 RepID=UPI002AB5F58F|nr:uncharacterized protein LOC133356401 isoform X1 [Lethenteron reissneri]